MSGHDRHSISSRPTALFQYSNVVQFDPLPKAVVGRLPQDIESLLLPWGREASWVEVGARGGE